MIAIDRRTGKVVILKKTKQAYAETRGTRDHITANACVFCKWVNFNLSYYLSAGLSIGPYARDDPDGALYLIYPNGYMDSELFYGLLKKLFIPQTWNIQGPKLLILNAHGSHLSIDLINLCRKNNIHMYCLLTQTTHVFEPLDVVIFHPLKAYFNWITQNLRFETLGWKEPINCCRINFTKLFKQPWESMTVALIKTGFQKSGIFPLYRKVIDTSQLSGNSSNLLHHHQIHQIQIHFHLQMRIHL